MNNTYSSSESLNDIGLNIHLLSFSLDRYNIKHDVKIIVTTYPEANKQEFVLKQKEIQFPNHVLSLKINRNSEKVFIFFQKKCLLSKDPILAWTVIENDHFPLNPQKYNYCTCGTVSGDIKTLNVYEYFVQNKDKNFLLNFSEKAVENFKKMNGQIDIQLTMTGPYLDSGEHKHSKNKNRHVKIDENLPVNYSCDYYQKENANCEEDDDEDGEITEIKLKKSDRKFHRKSKCSTDYATIE